MDVEADIGTSAKIMGFRPCRRMETGFISRVECTSSRKCHRQAAVGDGESPKWQLRSAGSMDWRRASRLLPCMVKQHHHNSLSYN